MGYPSLLYKTEPKLKPMDISVFEDLQLLNFIPRSVAKTARIPCEEENIIARQELFKSLSSENARALFKELYIISKDLVMLNGIYSTARCDSEREAVFLSIMYAERKFAEKASSANFSDPLSSCFAAAFSAELSGDEYKKMSSELKMLYSDFKKALCLSFKVHEQEVKAGISDEKTYFDRIEECSKTLGIGSPRVKETEARRLSPDIIVSLASHNTELFKRISEFYKRYNALYSVSVTYYGKELRFYLSMLDFLDVIRDAGIPLTYPTFKKGRGISVTEAYDVSLLAKNEKNIIPNDIDFSEEEPFYYLTGANGGGKTTYLRTVGIAAVLFMNGCPLPCRNAVFGELSSVFTHFPRDERFDGSGRFVEENGRVQKILESMDNNSLVLLNETYSTTNEENAVIMTEKLANELFGKRIFGLYITHQHSLAESEIPYLNVLIDRSDSNKRTFKIAKQKSTGGSYARDILERYSLTPEALQERFGALD